MFFVNGTDRLWHSQLQRPDVIAETERRKVGTLDIAGALTSTGGMAGAGSTASIHAATYSWGAPLTILSFVVAAVLLSLFVVNEGADEEPDHAAAVVPQPSTRRQVSRDARRGAPLCSQCFTSSRNTSRRSKALRRLQTGFAFLPMSFVIIVMARGCEPSDQ